MKSNTFQKLCMALSIAFLAAMFVSALSRFFPHDARSIRMLSPGLSVTTIAYFTMIPITLGVQLGIAIWLFRRNANTHRWMWFLLGVVLGVLALIVNLLFEISAKLDGAFENKETHNQKVDHISKGSNTSL
jgi:heme/copper-type cytochrome/quinol oxidase subunit 3